MGFVVLLAVAGVLGWLGSIVSRQDDGRSIALYVSVALIGALSFAFLVSRESMALGISAATLAIGAVGATLFVAGLALTRVRLVR